MLCTKDLQYIKNISVLQPMKHKQQLCPW